MPKTKSKSTASTPDSAETSVLAPNTVLTLTVPWSEVEPVYNQVLKTMAKRVKHSGFRPGKVPAHIAADIIGQAAIKEEVLQKVLPAAYQAAITKENKRPLTYPEIKPVKWELNQDWTVEAQIAERPEVSVKGYEKVAKKAKQTMAKEHVHEHTHGEDGKNPTSAGKEKTAEQLKAEEEEHTLQHIFRDLVVEYKPRIPELLVKEEARSELEQLVRSLKQLQMDLDGYLQRRQMTFEQLSNELASQALGRLQLEFILQAIIEQNALKAEEADYDEYFNRIKDEKTREQQRNNPEYKNYVGSLIIRRKVAEHLLGL